jgi:hypothetical protein
LVLQAPSFADSSTEVVLASSDTTPKESKPAAQPSRSAAARQILWLLLLTLGIGLLMCVLPTYFKLVQAMLLLLFHPVSSARHGVKPACSAAPVLITPTFVERPTAARGTKKRPRVPRLAALTAKDRRKREGDARKAAVAHHITHPSSKRMQRMRLTRLAARRCERDADDAVTLSPPGGMQIFVGTHRSGVPSCRGGSVGVA